MGFYEPFPLPFSFSYSSFSPAIIVRKTNFQPTTLRLCFSFVRMPSSVPFSPACPLGPPVIDVASRLQMLRKFLDPTSPEYFDRERQHPNLRAAIRAYETGEIDGTKRVWFADGKIVTYEEAMKFSGCVACEVSQQFCVVILPCQMD